MAAHEEVLLWLPSIGLFVLFSHSAELHLGREFPKNIYKITTFVDEILLSGRWDWELLRVGICTGHRHQQHSGHVPVLWSRRLWRDGVLLDSSHLDKGNPRWSQGHKEPGGRARHSGLTATLASHVAWKRRERAWGSCFPHSPLPVVGLLWGVTPSNPPKPSCPIISCICSALGESKQHFIPP